MKNFYRQVLLLFAVTLVIGCAQTSAPTGGPKDTTPPVVKSSFPENESVNFNGSSIELEFDEYIQLNDIYNQVIVSPPLDNRPEITVKKKTLTLAFKEELRPNTTYTVNFGEGIKDFTEGNILRNQILAFSTGAELDSLSVSGRVFDAFSTLPKENVKVMLYANLEDSMPETSRPRYFTQTSKSGRFTLNYLPEGNYKVFALEEEDGDFLFNESSENLAFLEKPIQIKPNIEMDSLDLFLFNEQTELGFVKDIETDSLGLFRISFDTPQKMVIATQNQEGEMEKPLQKFNKTRDTLVVFTTSTSPIYLERKDAMRLVPEISYDTLELNSFDINEVSEANRAIKVKPNFSKKIHSSEGLQFITSQPFDTIEASKIELRQDSTKIDSVSINMIDEFTFTINLPKTYDSRISGSILPLAIKNSVLENQDTLNFNISSYAEDFLGELIIRLEFSVENPLLVLRDLGSKQEKKFKLQENSITIRDIEPGEYELFLIDDSDRNFQWTTGNYGEIKQPEQVMKFPEKIKIRSNWSQEFIWRKP